MNGFEQIHEDAAQFRAGLSTPSALMGLDLGTKTIGVAISDRLWTVATARTTVKRRKFTQDAQALLEIAGEAECAAIVIGLPLNMDGSEGPRAQSTRAFARNLSRLTEMPMLLWDERLSTVAAERALLEADTSRKKRVGKIDNVAAAYILQGVLDRFSHH